MSLDNENIEKIKLEKERLRVDTLLNAFVSATVTKAIHIFRIADNYVPDEDDYEDDDDEDDVDCNPFISMCRFC